MTGDQVPPVVVHALGKLDRGGAETIALDLCHTIPAAEFQQVFLTLGDGEGRLAPQFRAAGAQVHRCPLIRYGRSLCDSGVTCAGYAPGSWCPT